MQTGDQHCISQLRTLLSIALFGASGYACSASAQSTSVTLEIGVGTSVLSVAASSALGRYRIVSALPDDNGGVYVLSVADNEMRAYITHGDETSKLELARLGKGGVLAPTRLLLLPGGHHAVLDRVHGLIPLQGAAAFGESARVLHPVATASDGCVFRDKILFLGYQEDKLLHEYSLDGRRGRSFAAAPRGDNLAHRQTLSSGLIACDSSAAHVFLGFRYSGEVRGVERNGRVTWAMRLPGFTGPIVRSIGNGVSVAMGPGKTYTLSAVGFIAQELLLIQAEERLVDPQGKRSVLTWLLDARTGDVRGTQADLPTFAFISHTRVIARKEPSLSVLSYEFRLRRVN